MLTSLIQALLPLVVRIVTYFLDKSKVEYEARQKWLEFIESLEDSTDTPTRLRKSYAKQKERLNAILKEIKEREGDKNE